MGKKITSEQKILKLQVPLFPNTEEPELLCNTADMKLCYRTTDKAHIEAIGNDLKAYWRVEIQYLSESHINIVFIEKVNDPALYF